MKRNYWIKSRNKPLKSNINCKKQESRQFFVCDTHLKKCIKITWHKHNLIISFLVGFGHLVNGSRTLASRKIAPGWLTPRTVAPRGKLPPDNFKYIFFLFRNCFHFKWRSKLVIFFFNFVLPNSCVILLTILKLDVHIYALLNILIYFFVILFAHPS